MATVCVRARTCSHVCTCSRVCMCVSLCIGKAGVTGERKGETVQLLEIVCSESASF